MKNAAGEAGGKEWTEVERAIFLDAASEINAGIFFGGGEPDVGIGFVVTQKDIELGVIFLDELIFERQSFAAIIEDDGFEIGDFTDERVGLGVNPARFQKIGTHAAAQGSGFADVQNGAGSVAEQVHPGLFGKGGGFFAWLHKGIGNYG